MLHIFTILIAPKEDTSSFNSNDASLRTTAVGKAGISSRTSGTEKQIDTAIRQQCNCQTRTLKSALRHYMVGICRDRDAIASCNGCLSSHAKQKPGPRRSHESGKLTRRTVSRIFVNQVHVRRNDIGRSKPGWCNVVGGSVGNKSWPRLRVEQ
jgi:hypothetical protein